MKVLFRTDASIEIGSGHLMRCLTLANQLSCEGAEITFVCRDLPGALFSVIEEAGYMCKKLSRDNELTNESDAKATIKHIESISTVALDVIVVDQYALDSRWEVLLKPYANKLMVIDDLANRPHDCDVLLDQNYYTNLNERYIGLVPDRCKTFLGPSYVLLRDEFYQAKLDVEVRTGVVKRVLVFFGGSDYTNQTLKVVEAIPLLNKPDIVFDIVVGASNPHKEMLEQLIGDIPNANFFCQVNNMAALMLKADLAIGAGGATTWERCVLGLPALTIVFAENQLNTTKDLALIDVIEFLGWSDNLTKMDYVKSILLAINAPQRLKALSESSLELMGVGSNPKESLIKVLTLRT